MIRCLIRNNILDKDKQEDCDLLLLWAPGGGFTNILDFRIANAFCPSIPESGIQRDLIEGLYMPLPPTQ